MKGLGEEDHGEEDDDDDEIDEEVVDVIPEEQRRFITKQWTAWPLTAATVPRDHEHKRAKLGRWVDESLTRAPPDTEGPPGDMLREVVMALILRKAKERIRAEGKRELKPGYDDDEAEKMLGPVVQGVIERVDRLLVGLHQERNQYVKNLIPTDHGGDAQCKWEQVKRDAREELPKDDDDAMQELPKDYDEEEDDQKTQTRKKRHRASPQDYARYLLNRRYKLVLRDWSQVLGMAAIRGWEDMPVARTAKRCADLFNEDMEFRAMGEKKGSETVWRAKEGPPTKSVLQEDPPANIKRRRRKAAAGDGFLEVIKVSWGDNPIKARFAAKKAAAKKKEALVESALIMTDGEGN